MHSMYSYGELLPRESFIITSMPEGPRDMDYIVPLGLVPTGEYLHVIINRYSRFLEVELVKSSETIRCLDRVS